MDPTILVAASELRTWSRNDAALRRHARETIEAEGGEIESLGMIGMLIRSPFPSLNLRPVYLRIRCRYPTDRGSWFLCGADTGTYWVWTSDTGKVVPPVERPYPVKVDGSVLALPRWASVALYVLAVAGLFGGFAAFLLYT